MNYDAIIIGSGISGSSLARELARYRLRTAVLEKGGDLCSGATRGNSATVHSGHDATFGTLKAKYNVLGNAMYDRLCAELSVPFRRNGTILFAASGAEWREAERLKKNADKNGVPGVRLLSREELEKLEGGWGEGVLGGLYAPTGGMVCPYTLAFALCENAAENGVDFYRGTEVTAIEKRPTGGFLLHTGGGDFTARYVFNCAGTHADEMNSFVSAHTFRIFPRKGEHIILDRKLAPYVRATWSQMPHDLPSGGHTKGMGLMPTVDGTILLGCDAHDVSDKDDMSTTSAGLEEVLGYFEENWHHLPISRACPQFPKHMVIGAFAGLRPHPEGDDFILGEAEDAPGFFNMAGIESPGVTAAPAIARDIAVQAAEKYGFPLNGGFQPLRRRPKPFREMDQEEREAAIAADPDYGRLICRCEQVTRAEVLQAIRGPVGARSVSGVKMRTRAGMGRCQGGFCGAEVVWMLSEELGIPMTAVRQGGEGSEVLCRPVCEEVEP